MQYLKIVNNSQELIRGCGYYILLRTTIRNVADAYWLCDKLCRSKCFLDNELIKLETSFSSDLECC